ncbi:hypothetical protein ACT17_05725 [Mycolicibacterium conceptionense]|jgi:hypothetical protein|uniref:Uncharacterized protein n=3 Tax=Mycolicibacterium TaxID=1866885 RepID=A0ABR5FQU5_9MYCO|nr:MULTISPECIES: hypothetical protein [Mycolicibacterium]KLI07123.1 hypothetical protein AA982_16535 [Mycolicibacterium senegalense]KLO50195.1 hypothetical protein ABW05_00335 [Mycolicibacterium senegalense]KMV19558.1 hypothetical protein ACT17_05725 [Mycolicibacterium conceptionense]OBK03779.1 hypothetical protein A5639_22025 [Mycolicibacterium conceptionense]OMB81892.1 hypothetical protein A5741_24750 [Mycolicibacterium conceptionense]
MTGARTYNQTHVPRRHDGRRRITIYWTWSYPWEAQRSPAALENRFSTMTEVRNALWPAYETPDYSEAAFLQGIAGTLELFHRSTLAFQELAGEVTGHPVAVFQRIDQAGYRLPIDERVLDDCDTLMVFGLDHILSQQEADLAEVTAIRRWLQRGGTCLLLAPHHDVGDTDDYARRQVEYLHHGDPLVPRQQRFGQYTRSLMAALDVPVHNTWGLRPAVVTGTTEIAPLTTVRDLDSLGLLTDVTTFNFHPHLPHYELAAPESEALRVLGRQLVDPSRPHPFTEAGNTAFNALIWMPPSGDRAGDIVLVDSTNFTTLFGGTDSLRQFWNNLATMR